MPLVTAFITLILSGLISFKFAPIRLCEFASARVWHEEQTALFIKISLPSLKIGSDCAGRTRKLTNDI